MDPAEVVGGVAVTTLVAIHVEPFFGAEIRVRPLAAAGVEGDGRMIDVGAVHLRREDRAPDALPTLCDFTLIASVAVEDPEARMSRVARELILDQLDRVGLGERLAGVVLAPRP